MHNLVLPFNLLRQMRVHPSISTEHPSRIIVYMLKLLDLPMVFARLSDDIINLKTVKRQLVHVHTIMPHVGGKRVFSMCF